LDIASLGVITEEEWRAFWPSAAAVEVVEDEPIEEDVEDEPVEEDVEPVEDEPVEEVDETPVDDEPVEEPEPEAAESK
ncbi:MAG TPA: nucleoside triphosphate pyrophosphohydrolase, partial [Mycobacterium sp.]|nr:nucleoside triphosphate pyrophosphohydrolase [Mycobacterium sp.]